MNSFLFSGVLGKYFWHIFCYVSKSIHGPFFKYCFGIPFQSVALSHFFVQCAMNPGASFRHEIPVALQAIITIRVRFIWFFNYFLIACPFLSQIVCLHLALSIFSVDCAASPKPWLDKFVSLLNILSVRCVAIYWTVLEANRNISSVQK